MDRPAELVLSNLKRTRARKGRKGENEGQRKKRDRESYYGQRLRARNCGISTVLCWDAFRQTEMDSHVLQSRFVMFFTVIFSGGFIEENARFSLRGTSSRECGKPFSCVVLQDLKESLRG